MAIEYFCCYHSYLQKVAKLSDQEVGRLFRALLIYSATGEKVQLAGREDIAFDFIADDIDRAKRSYERQCSINKKNGEKGGRPKKQTVSKKAGGSEITDGFSENRTVLEETEKSHNKDKDKNKDKKDKSDVKDVGQRKAFSSEEEAYQAAVYLDKKIRIRYPNQKPASERQLQSWALEFDRCHRLDGHSWEEIGQVLRFSQRDPFWQSNILSGGKFREKYLQLLAKMQQGSGLDKKQPGAAFPDYGDKEEYL